MKNHFLLGMFLFLSFINLYSQEKTFTVICEEKIKELNSKYIETHESYQAAVNELDSLKQQMDVAIDDQLLEAIKKANTEKQDYCDSLNNIVTLFKSHEAVCGIDDEKLKELLGDSDISEFETECGGTQSSEEISVYLYYGKDKVINEDIFDDNNKETEVIKSVLSAEVEDNYLADITIPKDGEEFNFYKYSGKDFNAMPDVFYKFRSVHFEISEGVFADIRAIVETEDGNLHIFENEIGVSILKFSTVGKKNYLFYRHSIRKGVPNKKYQEDKIKDWSVKLSDVLVYNYKLGSNYTPSDLVLELPVKDAEGNQTNKQGPATYKIKENTQLSSIVELRAYTDFLALFGDSDNGLVQFEGKANFYINPYPLALFGNANLVEFQFFDKVSPLVNYSRFDEDTRYIETAYDSVSGNYMFNRELDLVEKRYLTMGIDLNIFKFKKKGLPVCLDLFGTLNYQLSELKMDENLTHLKAVSYGPGARLRFKKFNNFGFYYTLNFSWYDYGNFNEISELNFPKKFRVFRNEFEVFYFPNKNPSQSIFLRLRTFNNSEPKNNEAFYQFQFGYRFSVGAKAVKKG
ncbi:hypothetical protein GZ212_13060 [Mangrovimonas sp. CR14]|uniref:hypothetical protein n=1 Tax=Mangrovimonas sp. CR14 TaxID=2706120 RepID=UPI00141F5F21|nr:hypothetical protein [Mangrovimonas sp. CR14]NIK93086.1 hypothetical protein [Mangrovimonas sp. CR14]